MLKKGRGRHSKPSGRAGREQVQDGVWTEGMARAQFRFILGVRDEQDRAAGSEMSGWDQGSSRTGRARTDQGNTRTGLLCPGKEQPK